MKNKSRIKCPICNNFFMCLTGKHLFKHGYSSVKAFLKDYPNVETISPSVRKKLSIHWEKKLKKSMWKRVEKATATKLRKYRSGEIQPWNKGLSAKSDERLRNNALQVKKTWSNKSKKEKDTYGKKVSARLKGRSWESVFGIEKARKRKADYQSKMKGEGSPFYIDGRTKDSPYYRGSNWLKISRRIRKRDEQKCQECNIIHSKLLVHHIINYHSFPNNKRDQQIGNANCELNLITLCFSCHSRLQQKDLLKVNTVRYLEMVKSKYLVTTTFPREIVEATYSEYLFMINT